MLTGATVTDTIIGVAPGGVTVKAAVWLTAPRVAVTLADALAVTAVVVMGNVWLVAPAGTVTVIGTVAAVLLLERVTTVPPAGAAPVRVTVPVDDTTPPTTLVGETLTDARVEPVDGGMTVRVVDWVSVPAAVLPLTFAAALAVTAVVVTEKVWVVAPAGTVTVAGTTAAALLLVRLTTSPPEGAGPLKVTVPVAVFPPTTGPVKLIDARVATGAPAMRVSVAVSLTPAAEAVTVTGVVTATPVDVIVKGALMAPAGTVMVAGTMTAGLPLLRDTLTPPSGAAMLSVTVPVAEPPPATVAGAMLSPVRNTMGGGGALTVREANWVSVPAEVWPLTLAVVLAVTDELVTLKVALVAPAGPVTVAGTATLALLLVSVTTVPPVGAGPLRVTVPVVPIPPTMGPVMLIDARVRPVVEGAVTVKGVDWISFPGAV